MIARHTGKPLADVERDTERDYFMDAKKSLEYGVVDKIIEQK